MKYGFLNLQSEPQRFADLYLKFYADSAYTIPIDVTTFGFTIAFQVRVDEQEFNAFGGYGASTSYIESSGTWTATGYSVLVEPGFGLTTFDAGTRKSKIRSFVSIVITSGGYVWWNGGIITP